MFVGINISIEIYKEIYKKNNNITLLNNFENFILYLYIL